MVGIDTNIFIYILERDPEFFESARNVLKQLATQGQKICVPSLLFTEVLSGTDDESIISFMMAEQFVVQDLTLQIAHLAGNLRYKNPGLKTPDSIHLATALACGANSFITNDQRLSRLDVGLKIIPLDKFELETVS